MVTFAFRDDNIYCIRQMFKKSGSALGQYITYLQTSRNNLIQLQDSIFIPLSLSGTQETSYVN